jgi:DNA-binding winged helix-turn-helix (wHTH) protein
MNHKLAPESLRVGQWWVDATACELCDGDTVVRLRPKVMDLLAAFARNPGEVLSKNCLLDMVWPEVTVGDASLTVAVGELRDALGER